MPAHPPGLVATSRWLLEVENLQVSYGGIRAVSGVSIKVAESQIVALIGRNGAGKSSSLRAVSGFLPSEGARVQADRLSLAGVSLLNRRPSWIARHGVAVVPERVKIFSSLTVEENLLVTAPKDAKGALERVYGYFPALKARRASASGYLSGGERQMLAIGRALLLEPTLLVADELSFGLSPAAVQTLVSRLQAISREEKLAMLLAEQSFDVAAVLATDIYVFETGSVVAEGSTEELLSREDATVMLLGLRM
jgi:branched-chain amino acid transport system ATP-binding protein